MILSLVTLWITAVMFGALGVLLLLSPEKLGDWLSLNAGSSAARTELRALYGGLEIGIALFCAYCALSPSRRATGCVAVALFLGAIGAARIFGMWLDGSASPQMFGFLASEIVLAVMGAIAASRLGSVDAA